MPAKTAPETLQGPIEAPEADRSATDAIAILAAGIADYATAIRSLTAGWPEKAHRVTEPLGSGIESGKAVSRLAGGERRVGPPVRRVGEPDVAALLDRLTLAVEFVASAVQALTASDGASGDAAIRYALMADAKLTEALRGVPEEQFRGAVMGLWGRETMPVRLR